MTMMAIAGGGQGKEAEVRGVTLALRRLILSGEHFHNTRARQLQLGSSDLVALAHLFNSGPIAPRDLAAMMGITSGSITAMLDRVEKAGFLARTNNPEDRRSILVSITSAGQDAIQWLYEEFDASIREALTSLPGLEAAKLETALEVVSAELEAGSADQGPVRSLHPRQPPRRPHGI
ncbi:MarR family winged helix-turn-helix transcriptional regulator [Arthrobacter sp. GCM10027362]|uniref:MarR family winged helix-turn-helix transcriptional regulator n=1 Tax=Arthrobacter sp. GCM10027362 TaxID=3273379 RepID=UPI0036347135